MEGLNFAQIIVITLLSSGLMGGIFALITKSMWSPESKNDLAKLGDEFAHQLLQDARSEREELRLTIKGLEDVENQSRESIHRLQRLLDEKDRVIKDLEARQVLLATKLQEGKPITLQDIFGEKAPEGFLLTNDEPV